MNSRQALAPDPRRDRLAARGSARTRGPEMAAVGSDFYFSWGRHFWIVRALTAQVKTIRV